MFAAAIAVIKWLWPFFQESVFKDESFKSWAKNNIKLCAWIGLWVVMILAIFQMADLVGRASRDAAAAKQELAALKQTDTVTLQSLTFSRHMVQSLAEEVAWSRKALVAKPPPAVVVPDTPEEPRQKPRTNPRVKPNKNDTLIETLQDWDRKHQQGLPTNTPSLDQFKR